jgi:UDP-N-acetylglucosamine 2-epimerase (non-hydrolysing)
MAAKAPISKIILVMGARPNFMKVAPLVRHDRKALRDSFQLVLVHTGQHYDEAMSGVFLRQLGITDVRHQLDCGGGSHAEQTARIMIGFERVCQAERPDWVVVVGDVNSTIACALVAKKLGISVCHIEAGLRSFNRAMPEEINRLATDAISDLLLTTCEDADRQLADEGVPACRVRRVGNLMIDSLRHHLEIVEARPPESFGLPPHEAFGVVTLHRPANVEDEARLRAVIEALKRVAERIPLFFPCHPRTRANLERLGLHPPKGKRLVVGDPIDYFGMLGLYRTAKLVVTDSGGVQEETTALQIPCLTVRSETERPITVTEGTNTLIGDPDDLEAAVEAILAGRYKAGNVPALWDGRAGERVWDALRETCLA